MCVRDGDFSYIIPLLERVISTDIYIKKKKLASKQRCFFLLLTTYCKMQR